MPRKKGEKGNFMESRLANKYVYQQRAADLMRWIIDGIERQDIIEMCGEKYPQKRDATIFAYQKAKNDLKQYKKENIEQLVNIHVLRYEDLYRRLKGHNWNTIAMKALKQKEKMLQIEEKNAAKILLEGNAKALDAVDYTMVGLPDEKKKRMGELLNKINKK